MGPVHAVKTCLRKSLTFSGRASRPEYWWFLPVGLLLPLTLNYLSQLVAPNLPALWRFLVLVIALLPLVAVTTRRLRDTGQHSDGVRIPTEALAGFAISLWALFSFHGWAMTNFETVDGPGGLGLLIIYLLGIALLGLLTLRFFLLGLLTGSGLFSQMAASSAATEDITGPNPHEVSP